MSILEDYKQARRRKEEEKKQARVIFIILSDSFIELLTVRRQIIEKNLGFVFYEKHGIRVMMLGIL